MSSSPLFGHRICLDGPVFSERSFPRVSLSQGWEREREKGEGRGIERGGGERKIEREIRESEIERGGG